jgi:hypothetical protein
VWIANAGNNSVTKLDNSGNAVSGTSGFTAGALSYPSAIAVVNWAVSESPTQATIRCRN